MQLERVILLIYKEIKNFINIMGKGSFFFLKWHKTFLEAKSCPLRALYLIVVTKYENIKKAKYPN